MSRIESGQQFKYSQTSISGGEFPKKPDGQWDYLAEAARSAHQLRISTEGFKAIDAKIPAPTGDERLNLIDKGLAMKHAPGNGLTPREFVGITDIATRLTDRIKIGGRDNEALTVFASAKGDGSEVRVHHSYPGESVNVVFTDPQGSPVKRIVVGENFGSHHGSTSENPKTFMEEQQAIKNSDLNGVVIFDETNPQKRRMEPLLYSDAKFVGVALFNAALSERERTIAKEDALTASPLIDSLQQLITRNS